MLSGSVFGLSVMVVVIIAGTSWVWMAGMQMSTDHNLVAQTSRVAPKGPLAELPTPPRSQSKQPSLPVPSGAKLADTRSSTFTPDLASSSTPFRVVKLWDHSGTKNEAPVASATSAAAALHRGPSATGYYIFPASPALDEDDPVASSELREWLKARNLSFLAASLEQLGAYHSSDLALLDDKDKR